MNNIYKVIWSKAKNCYVVASEIARSHTKSATGSEKIGGVTRRSLLASLMALSLLCGGLGVASASLEVLDQSGTAGTVTIYTKDEVDNALTAKGTAADVASNKEAITNLKNAVGDAGSGLTKEVADQKAAIAANTASITTNKDNITQLDTKKLDKDLANSTFATKDALNGLAATVNNKVDESVVETALDGKADKADTLAGYGIKDAYTKGDVDNKLNEKADAANVNTALAGKANVGDSYTKAEADGKFATSEALNTAKTDLEGKITSAKNELDGKITANTQKIGANETAITDLKDADVRLEGKINQNTNDITGLKDKDVELSGKIDNNKNLIDQNAANITQNKNDIAAIGGRLTTAEGNIQTNADAINALDTKVGTINNGNYLDGTKSVGENLNALDAQTKTNTDEIARVNQELVNTNNHFNTELGKTNTALNKEVQERVDADTKLTGRIDATDKRTAGIKRTDTGVEEDNQTVIEGKVHFDQNGNVSDVKDLSAETITTTGDAAIGGALGVTGATTLDGALMANGEATFKDKVSVEKDLTVDGKLNVGEIYLEHKKLESTGKEYDSATSITADGISNRAKVTDEHGNSTESKFTHNEKGTFNYATDKDGNKTYTKVTATENSFQVQDKDAKNKNHQVNTKDSSVTEITNEAGATTKTEQTAENITNTAEKGTITNKAKDIANNATGDMTNTVGGNQTNQIDGNQANTIGGDQTTTVTGDISNTAKNITNEATTKLTDKVGANTRVLDGEGITDTVGGSTFKQRIDAIMGNVKTADGESEVTQKGDEINSVVGKGEATNSRVTQKKGSIEAAVTDGINTNDSYDVANASAKVLSGGTKVNKLQDNLDSSEKTITDGTYTTSKVQTALDIINTAADGTITNDAKDIVNNATGDMTNTVGGNLTTTVGGNEIHDVKGTKAETVEGKVTENFKGGQETNVTGDQTTNVSGTQTTNATDINRNASSGMIDKVDNAYGTNTETKVAGKTTTEVSIKGTGETAGYIRGATESRDYLIKGTLKNSESKTAETTSTEITDGNGKISSTIQDVTQISGSVTDGTNTSVSNVKADSIDSSVTGGTSISTINQRKDSITSQVTDGTTITKTEQTAKDITNTAKDGTITNDAKDIVNKASGDMTNTVGGKLTTTVTGATEENYNGGLTTKVTGEEKHTVTGKQTNTVEGGQENIISGGQINKITGDQTTTITGNKKETVTENVTEDYKKDLTTTVGGNEIHDVKGTKTETVEGKVTENFKGGQETNVTGNQDIHVTGKQTNKIDGDQENTIGGNQTTTVTGDISNKAKNITNEASNSITDKVGDHTRVLDSDGITDTVGGSTFKQRIDKIMMESKNVSIKAEETLTNEAKVITNKASEVINNEAVNINNTATGIITSKASEIKNQADKLISNKVGENTWENMEDGKIVTSIKDGAKQNLTQSDAAGTTQSTVDGKKSSVTNQTASQITSAVADGAGNVNASVANATTSANTITNGTKANTVISTADGTSFSNSEAAAPVTGVSGAGTAEKTTIKGNTITTGKVTMDYAEVMKDLGVRGNANIAGKTTTGELEVTGKSTLKGDVTMESNATVKKDLTVEGTTTTKTLHVTENATVGGTLDVAKKATFGDSVSIAKDLSVGGNATITGDVTAKSYKVGDKTYISADGINANDQKITNVADGSISEGSKDAVNGGQLYGMKRDLEHQVDKVGANAAAMANLHPMEFDPDSKWNIAAAMGNYGSETAAALGAFYRPNDDVMVNLSTAFGTGENMVGGGVSVRLGKGGNKLSREESNALKAQVADLTARMDALLSVLNPNMSKDFPDVPENHWAYEAVSRLAGNDIIQGYPDGEFHGDRTMTRYEMAEIIYNALSRGAEAEKELVEEFKPELQAMAASEKATAEKAEG